MNEDVRDPVDQRFNFFELVPMEFIVEMVSGLIFFVCMFVCWRVLSSNPVLRRLGKGFGFYCLMFVAPVFFVAIEYLLVGEGASVVLFWASELLPLAILLVGTYFLVTGSRALGRADVDV